MLPTGNKLGDLGLGGIGNGRPEGVTEEQALSEGERHPLD
jgi:hypothetical protein